MSAIQQLTGHTTVQASAGSGKTYLLISRIVRLLLTGAEAGNILAITFTRKAANEMQTRLLERLFELATCDSKILDKALRDLQLKAIPTTVELARNLYEALLRSDAPVKTSTFHAFCQELLRRFPMEADVSPGFDLLDKTTLLYDEAWDALMNKANKDKDSELAIELQFLFKELGLYNTQQALNNFLDHRSDWWAFTTNQESPVFYAKQLLEKQININAEFNPIDDLFKQKIHIEQLNEFHILLSKHDTKTNQQTSQLIYKVIDESLSTTKRYQFFTACFLTKTGSIQKRKESNVAEKKMGAEGQARFLELHSILSNVIIEINAQIAAIRTFKTTSAWYVAGEEYLKQFQKIKKEQRALDFTDLEWQTYLLLNKSNNALWVQYKLDQRIEHLLIDEFQDTNPTQWRLILPLLEEIAASDDERQRSVFIVGDEKQSIYRFRRAEPRLFVAAEQWLKQRLRANTCPLSHSWRSSPAIISFVNNLFLRPEFNDLMPNFVEHATHKKDLPGTVTLLPLMFKETLVENEEKIQTLRNPLKQPRIEITSEHYFNEGLLIADEINHLVKNNVSCMKKNGLATIEYDDIIILLRNRTHVSEYERALRQANIPYIGANRGTLLESLEVNDMLDLLQWLILPFDNLSLAGILRSPLFSLSNNDLIVLKKVSNVSWFEKLKKYCQKNPERKDLSRAYQLLTKWQEDASKLPVHDLLDIIYSEANVLARYKAAFPTHLAQRVIANLNRFLELALEMDSGRYPSLTRFSSWLNELRQFENEAPDEPVTSSSHKTEKRVRILSVHSAKGLEAPVVFLADSANSPSNKKAYSTLIDWPAENDGPEYFLLTGAKKNLDPFSQQCIEEQDFFEQREDSNLLYVALTRAKQYLYISGSEGKDKKFGWYGKIASAYDQDIESIKQPVRLESFSEHEQSYQQQMNLETNIQMSPIDTNLSLPVILDTSVMDISPSQLANNIAGKTLSKNDCSNSDNTERGIIMHQMLNQLSRSPISTLEQFYSSDIRNIDYNHLESWWKECQDIVNNAQLSELFDSSRFEKFYNEVPIQFKDNGQVVYGIIDRIVIHDKTVTVIDYKTHPYVNEDNIKQLSLQYQSQMNYYKKGVQLLWPDFHINTILLFTATASAISL